MAQEHAHGGLPDWPVKEGEIRSVQWPQSTSRRPMFALNSATAGLGRSPPHIESVIDKSFRFEYKLPIKCGWVSAPWCLMLPHHGYDRV